MYLWYKHGGSAAPIVALAVLYDDEPVPEGYQKIAKDVTKGVDAKVFLAVLRQSPGAAPADQPLSDIKLLLATEEAPGEHGLARPSVVPPFRCCCCAICTHARTLSLRPCHLAASMPVYRA